MSSFATNGAAKSIEWSVIDSQLWLKPFTVAPSLMKEGIGFFFLQSGPSSMSSTVRGNQYRTCHGLNKDIPCAKTPCSKAHKYTKPGCDRDHPGIRVPHPLRIRKQSPPSSFGGIVTSVNVLNLQHGVGNHPNKEFVNTWN